MKQHALRVSDELWELIETARGRKARNAWLNEIIERAIRFPPAGGYLAWPAHLGGPDAPTIITAEPVRTNGPGGPISLAPGRRVHRANCGCPVCKPPKKEKA